MRRVSKSKRPNILLILTDQQRFDTIAALGNPIIKTPALDRLVREGTTFRHCYTPSPVCVSARCALITGLPPHATGCVDNMPMPQNVPSFMERLQTLGYQTHGVGKMHFTPDPLRAWGYESRDVSEEMQQNGNDFREFLRQRGYAHVDDLHGVRSEYYYIPQPSQLPAELHNTAWVADRSLDFLKRRDRQRPFFLWASFIKPHPPFESPTPWNKLYRAAEMPKPFRPEGYERLLTFWNKVQNRYKYRDAGFDDLFLRTMKAAYYACISFIDFHVGRILDGLNDVDNTLILFTSDHGELLGDYGSFGKRCMLNPAVRVPMLVRFPSRFQAGAVCETPVSLLDVLPTFLSAAGAKQPTVHREGVDLSQLATGESDRTVYSQFQAGGYGVYMAASRDRKYFYSAPDNREWLFDLRVDPKETTNLAMNPLRVGQCQTMRAQLIRRFRADGYEQPLDDDKWKRFPTRTIPDDPDAGLLFQDAANLQSRLDALGEYARDVTVRGINAIRLLLAED
jgi:choline-sulfatase